MILKKIGEEYKLYAEDDSCIATTQESPYKRLSKQNCDEMFGIIDVGALALEECNNTDPLRLDSQKYKQDPYFRIGYLKGFNKAVELNKDKLFTLEQFKQGIVWGYDRSTENIYLSRLPVDEFIQLLLQQPTEIEVEIEMLPYSSELTESEVRGFEEHAPNSGYKLDENGCLILTKNK